MIPQTATACTFTPGSAADAKPSHFRKMLNILLVEDTPSDEMLATEALETCGIPHRLHVLHKGRDVARYLRRSAPFEKAATPDLILLDVGLPDQDGFETLTELSALPLRLRHVPIVMLTGYSQFGYAMQTYPLWIPAYLTKPCSAEKLKPILWPLWMEKNDTEACIR